VQAIADLMAVAAEADVFQGLVFAEGVNPVGEDALGGVLELTGAGHHAAAVAPGGEIEGAAVFEGQVFAGDFGAAVERNGR